LAQGKSLKARKMALGRDQYRGTSSISGAKHRKTEIWSPVIWKGGRLAEKKCVSRSRRKKEEE